MSETCEKHSPHKGEAGRVPQRGGARGQGAEEHCAADSAEEHGLPEADHRASPRKGRGHIVVRVPSLSSLPAGRLHVVGLNKARRQQQDEEEVQLVVRRVWRPVRLEEPKQSPGH